MQYLLGCLGIIVLLAIAAAILQWIFNNIVVFIGLGIVFWGFYKWYKNKSTNIKSKTPIFSIIVGVLIFFSGLAASDTDNLSENERTLESEKKEENIEVTEEQEEKNEEDIEAAEEKTETSEESEQPTENKDENVSKNTTVIAPIAKSEPKTSTSASTLGLVAATVSRVIDGDTFELSDGSRVRLIGVNTPESTTRTETYGKEASNYTKSKIEGKTVYLQKDVSETDRYGRLLRLVWLEVPTDVMDENEIRTKMFNADLVLNGYAEPSTYPPDVTYADYFRKFAREAREKGTGLWAYGNEGTTKGDFDSTNTSSNNSNTKSNTVSNNSSNTSSTNKNTGSNNSTNSTNSNSNTNSSPKTYSGVEVIPGAPTNFKNCDEMRKYYPNGVPSGHPAYAPARDRDKDGWACER